MGGSFSTFPIILTIFVGPQHRGIIRHYGLITRRALTGVLRRAGGEGWRVREKPPRADVADDGRRPGGVDAGDGRSTRDEEETDGPGERVVMEGDGVVSTSH